MYREAGCDHGTHEEVAFVGNKMWDGTHVGKRPTIWKLTRRSVCTRWTADTHLNDKEKEGGKERVPLGRKRGKDFTGSES